MEKHLQELKDEALRLRAAAMDADEKGEDALHLHDALYARRKYREALPSETTLISISRWVKVCGIVLILIALILVIR